MKTNKSCVFPNIAIAMKCQGDSLETLSKKLKMSSSALSDKLAGEVSFELPEIMQMLGIYPAFGYEKLFERNDKNISAK